MHTRTHLPAPPGPLPRPVHAVFAIECGAVGAAALALFCFPAWSLQHWAWPIAPYHARFTGAAYIGALVPLLMVTLQGRLVPGRLGLWLVLVFTGCLGAVMLPYAARFDWARPATWGFFALYLFLPVNAALWLHRLRHAALLPGDATPAPWRVLLQVAALANGAIALALLALPTWAARAWPWPVDEFHARLYAAIFATLAAGAAALARRAAPSERVLIGATLLALGLAVPAGLAWTSHELPARRIDFSAPPAFGFVALFTIYAVVGAALLAAGRPTRQRQSRHENAGASPV